MLHKMEHSKTSDSWLGEETKQARFFFFFCKVYSFVLLSLCSIHSLSSCCPPSQLCQRNNVLVNLFSFQ